MEATVDRGMCEMGAAVRHDFDVVAAREFRPLVATAWAIVGDHGLAEEIVQEALFKAYRRWSTLGASERPGAWLQTVVTRDALSRLRRLRTEVRLLGRLARRHREQPALSPDVLAFWTAVRTLSPERQRVVALRVAGEYQVTEIAEALGLPANTVKSHLRRAREELRPHLLDLEALPTSIPEEDHP